MKNSLKVCAFIGLSSVLLLSGCASTQPVGGMLYADVKGPVAATSNPRGPATGEACATSYLGLVALGDASIQAAAQKGGVLSISHVDHKSTNLLGLINTYCTQVWGSKGAARPPASVGAPRPAAPANP